MCCSSMRSARGKHRLRTDECRANLLPYGAQLGHDGGGRARAIPDLEKMGRMAAGAWRSHPADLADGRSLSPRRHQEIPCATIVEDPALRGYRGDAHARSDSGHVLVQKQIPVFMQRSADASIIVVVAADRERKLFGVYLPYRGWDPRPVAGDAGLIASGAWHPSHMRAIGSTQLQRRFEKAGRAAHGPISTIRCGWRERLRERGRDADGLQGRSRHSCKEYYLLLGRLRDGRFQGPSRLSFRPWNQQLPSRHASLADGQARS